MRRVLNGVARVIDGITWAGVIASGVFIFFILFLIVQGVFMRRVLHDPQSYSHELSRYAMVPLTALALAYAQKMKGHVAVDLLVMRLPRTAQKILFQIAYLIFLVYAVGLILATWDKTMLFFRAGMTSEDVKVPMWIISIMIPVGLGALCLQILVNFGRGIAGFWSRGETASSGGRTH